MLTIGFVLLVIALALVGFGVMSSPAVGPVRVAFYFLLFLSVSILIYGMVQTEIHVDPRSRHRNRIKSDGKNVNERKMWATIPALCIKSRPTMTIQC
jgi:hypothetical protein